MGSTKRLFEEYQEQLEIEQISEWIEENYEEGIEEGTIEWYQGKEAYYEHLHMEYIQQNFEEEVEVYFDEYQVATKTRYDLFTSVIRSSRVLNLMNSNDDEADKNLKVMLYGHVVAATEGFLFFTFIDEVMNSDLLIKKLVETSVDFSNQKVPMSEIFQKHERLKLDVRRYLEDLIFHNIAKVKVLYKNVLGVEFGTTDFLYKAVSKRHDCVHRAGYDKDGNTIELSTEEVDKLIVDCEEFVNGLNQSVINSINELG